MTDPYWENPEARRRELMGEEPAPAPAASSVPPAGAHGLPGGGFLALPVHGTTQFHAAFLGARQKAGRGPTGRASGGSVPGANEARVTERRVVCVDAEEHARLVDGAALRERVQDARRTNEMVRTVAADQGGHERVAGALSALGAVAKWIDGAMGQNSARPEKPGGRP